MDVKGAVQKATEYIDSILKVGKNENVAMPLSSYDFAIEGVRYDEKSNVWRIEVGYVQPWDKAKMTSLSALSSVPASNSDKRTYKVIIIPEGSDDKIQMTSAA